MAGQINRGWHLGDTLYELASKPEVQRVLEVGTWRGDGSTYVLATALAKTGGRLWSLELKSENFEEACRFYEGMNLPVDLLHGASGSPDWYPPFEEYWPRIAATRQEALEPGSYREWYEDEVEHVRMAPAHNLVDALVEQVGSFDLVLLDGGEFASDQEFDRLEPYIDGYIVMDDTNAERCIKNVASRDRLIASPQWKVIRDAMDERNGWIAAQKVLLSE